MLRTGFTTGTAAAAATKAAAVLIIHNAALRDVDVPLPKGGRLVVPVASAWKLPDGAEAVVIKDGGDDPDATHGAHIHAQVRLDEGGEVHIHGGPGVGQVTRPGLILPVGEAAINPVPRQQITAALREVLPHGGAHITISVEDGEAIAQKTLNPRLGIVGGISILGTRGTVRPFSHGAYRATIRTEMAMARAAGVREVLLTTGGRSETFFRHHHPEPWTAIQVADHVAFALRQAAHQGMVRVHWALFLGKLIKQAQGMPCTHARFGGLDMERLQHLAQDVGIDLPLHLAPTALAAEQMLSSHPKAQSLYLRLMEEAARHAWAFARVPFHLGYTLFNFQGDILATWRSP